MTLIHLHDWFLKNSLYHPLKAYQNAEITRFFMTSFAYIYPLLIAIKYNTQQNIYRHWSGSLYLVILSKQLFKEHETSAYCYGCQVKFCPQWVGVSLICFCRILLWNSSACHHPLCRSFHFPSGAVQCFPCTSWGSPSWRQCCGPAWGGTGCCAWQGGT